MFNYFLFNTNQSLVNELKDLKVQLNQGEKDLRTILNSLSDGIAIISSDLELLYANDNIIQILDDMTNELAQILNTVPYIFRAFKHGNTNNTILEDLQVCFTLCP